MLSECHLQMIVVEGLNQDLIREVAICYYPQCEEKTQRNPHLPWEPNPSDLILQGFLFYILTHFTFSFHHTNLLFL